MKFSFVKNSVSGGPYLPFCYIIGYSVKFWLESPPLLTPSIWIVLIIFFSLLFYEFIIAYKKDLSIYF